MIINNKKFNILFFFLSCFWLTACSPEKNQLHQHQLFVFGTLVDISVWHDDANQVTMAISEISDTFNQMHTQWHAWKPGRLQQINQQLQQGKTVNLTTEESHFIAQTIDYSLASNHLFNPTIGKIISLWGFHTDEYPILTPPPDSTEIQALIDSGLNVNVLQLENQQFSSTNPNVWLDFGGIAKGYAIDQAIKILQKHHVNSGIVNAGGDLRSLGAKGNKPWRIAIQSPTDWSTLADFTVMDNEAVFTSGNYQRFKQFDGKRYAHIIDPNTGMPVDYIVSATVITDQGIKADAAATALVVAGKDWYQTAAAMGIDQALVINERHQCFTTKLMLRRLENLSISCDVID
ncbi:MAG: FAD:protein FMN transferase [Xanthomonadales bacterium]|nr:FAD:protein FMN transferase [Xanthomonadales bacterium]